MTILNISRALTAIGIIALTAGCSASAEGEGGGEPEETLEAQSASLTGTHKICIIRAPSPAWRDTINVDNGWGKSTCAQYATDRGAPLFGLGCLTDSGYVLAGTAPVGTPGVASVPTPNCGW